MAGYDGADPRSYDAEGGCLIKPELRFLDKRVLVTSWYKHEMKQRKKNRVSPASVNDADFGIFLDNWRSLLLETTIADASTANATADR